VQWSIFRYVGVVVYCPNDIQVYSIENIDFVSVVEKLVPN